MLYRKVPKNGDELSVLGFGAMRLPMLDEENIDEQRAIAQMREAIDNGVNYLDTAWPYHGGQSEIILGKALKDGYRDKVKIATKLPQWLVESREDMDEFLNKQLKKLDVEQIDYYLVHAVEGNAWTKLEKLGIADFLDKALADGRIVNAGFSFHGVADDFMRIVDAYPWTFCQIQYNFLDQENQAGTAGLEYAASKDLAVIIMEPLRGGNISIPVPPPAIEELWATSDVKRTPVEWALRWIWNRPEVTVVLSGMNDEAHVAENLAIASVAEPGSLSEAELQLVDDVAAKYKELMKVGCTGCAYCVPCPVGVRIPACFELYNSLHMFKNESAKYMYAVMLSDRMTGQSGYASQCIQCGECLEKCPQHISIPDELEKVVADLESEDMEAMVRAAIETQENI